MRCKHKMGTAIQISFYSSWSSWWLNSLHHFLKCADKPRLLFHTQANLSNNNKNNPKNQELRLWRRFAIANATCQHAAAKPPQTSTALLRHRRTGPMHFPMMQSDRSPVLRGHQKRLLLKCRHNLLSTTAPYHCFPHPSHSFYEASINTQYYMPGKSLKRRQTLKLSRKDD